MLFADTNILSTFAKVNQLTLLFRLFGDERIGVVPAVYVEVTDPSCWPDRNVFWPNKCVVTGGQGTQINAD